MDAMIQDVRYAARVLRRSPLFALVVSVTLALGMGANTAIFSVFDALMLRKPAVPEPDRLVVFTYSDDAGEAAHFAIPDGAKYQEMPDIFSSVAVFQVVRRAGAMVMTSGTAVDVGSLDVAMVSPTFFLTIGIAAATGRTIMPGEGDHAGRAVMAISDGFARRAFGSPGSAPGRTVALLGTTYTVVGVLPGTFQGAWTGSGADAWVPLALQPAVMPERPDLLTNTRTGMASIVARLLPGVSARQASDAVNAIFQNGRTIPPVTAVMTPERVEVLRRLRLLVEPVASVSTADRTRLAAPLTLLMAAVTIVLIIACANVSNLMLARAAARNREIAIRRALGSGRLRLLRQLLAESALLAIAGTVLGLFIVVWSADALVALLSDPRAPLALNVAPDGRLLGFAAALCVVTTAAFGLAPAVQMRTASLQSAFATHAGATTSRGQRRTLNALMVTQVALSTVLLVGAGLFARTLHNLRTSDTGFDTSRLVLAWFDAGQAGYNAEQTLPLYGSLSSRIAALPGVQHVTESNRGMFAGIDSASPVVIPGRPVLASDDYWVSWNLVGDDFFRTTGMAVVSGRELGPGDTAAAPLVVAVNEAFARKYFGTSDVVGRTFHMRRETAPAVEIVAVVRDARLEGVRDSGAPMIFVPYRQDPAHLAGEVCVIARTGNALSEIAPAIRRVGRQVAPRVPLVAIQTANAQVEQSLAADRATATLSILFGVLSGVLVLVGLYGLLAYSVECRTGEIGIRTALGATRSDVVGMVFREGSRVVAIGLMMGLPLAWAVSRLVSDQLFGVAPGDPITFGGVAVLLAAAGVAAGLVPAARAAHVQPMTALRRD
jgi:predicted permease